MKNLLYILLPFIILSISACGNTAEESASTASEENEAQLSAASVMANNSRIKTGPLATQTVEHQIACTGQLDIPPTDVIAVHSKIGGQVKSIQYLPGDYVNKGAFLMSIENPQLVEKQRLLLETKAQLTYAEKEYARKKTLRNGQATTEQAYDQSLQQKELLSATYNGLRTELKLLGIDVEELEKNQKFQSSINVYASEHGYVHKVFINQGQMISPEDELMVMANNQHLHVELQVFSQDIAFVKKGQKVQFTVPGHQPVYEAEIVKVNPMLEEEQSTLQVHCHIEGKNTEHLLPGLFVNARILAGEQSLSGLPESGVIKEGETYFAYQVRGEGFEKVALPGVKVQSGFVTFAAPTDATTWVVEGAYYVE